ncbi:hypothetical protein [Novosphingobium album (ex Liu et al. 2023)]|uniref:Uncharacterized protein n=1 Tax=Novosphingobium album (ex Liu et al. 2023) TaxID=3031130 RepID=A0ABT5WMJ7_9SPHN|nr:hypothetical protein [Novosphingobium album (ex Liu et al. 2023)]MDE8651274.1 hypothetical protein [Novosphingobium album (ex Liu et al. 2023)]
MKASLGLFSACALIPAMIGPLEAAQARITVALCGGGAMTMPVEAPQLPGNAQSPCCAKGCQPDRSRKRIDRTQ